jgi:hypothetical protein
MAESLNRMVMPFVKEDLDRARVGSLHCIHAYRSAEAGGGWLSLRRCWASRDRIGRLIKDGTSRASRSCPALRTRSAPPTSARNG